MSVYSHIQERTVLLMWYQNPLLRTALQMALKKSNQRLVQLAKTFGPNSEIYKREAGILQKGAAQKYITTSSGINPITKVYNPANINTKIDISKLNKDIFAGNINRSDLNRLLSEVAGIRVDQNGDVVQIANQGIKTVGQIRKDARKRLERMGEDPSELTADEVIDLYEDILGFENSFQSAYEIANQRLETKALTSDPITSKLYGTKKGGTRADGERLTYNELKQIRDRFVQLAAEAKRQTLSFEAGNTEEK